MLRVLHVNYRMDCGGIETLLLNLHRCIDRSKLQFDYFLYGKDETYPHYYRKDILELGGKMWFSHSFQRHKYWQDFRDFGRFLDEHPEYKIVHVHTYYPTLYLWAARRRGRVAITHSHNSYIKRFNWKDLARKICVYPHSYLADYFFACSKQAGIDKYGKKADVKVINNGIYTDNYIFTPETRKAVRESRGIISEQTLVLGHVGRMSLQKNHWFLVDLFRKVHDRVPDSKLWLIGGDAELGKDVRQKVRELGLEDSVDFVGLTDKVNEYLMGMDVFVFPSFWEGLSVALIEAQASGLPCVVSAANQDDGIISDRVRRLRLGPPPVRRIMDQ